MTWILALIFSPLLLPLAALFELFALGRRLDWKWLQAVAAVPGLPVDILANYTVFLVLGPYPWRDVPWLGRTVTARVATQARWAMALARRGEVPGARDAIALAVATYLNARDPGHCAL